MKIQELITLGKIDLEKMGQYRWMRLNKTQEKYKLEKGYCWKIPSHSANESVLLNSYERDCVIAYIDNKYFTAFLIETKRKDKFRGFCYIKENMRKLIISSYAYVLSPLNGKNVFDLFREEGENLKIVDEDKYKRFSKLAILEAIDV